MAWENYGANLCRRSTVLPLISTNSEEKTQQTCLQLPPPPPPPIPPPRSLRAKSFLVQRKVIKQIWNRRHLWTGQPLFMGFDMWLRGSSENRWKFTERSAFDLGACPSYPIWPGPQIAQCPQLGGAPQPFTMLLTLPNCRHINHFQSTALISLPYGKISTNSKHSRGNVHQFKCC